MFRKMSLMCGFSILMLAACTNDKKEDNPLNDCSNGPSISLVSKSNTSCGQSIGNITVNATGGNGSYNFSLDGGAFQSLGEFNTLAAGSYTLTVKDGNGCTDNIVVVIGNDNGANFTVSTLDAGCDINNGEISITATGGTPPYNYKLDNSGTYQSNNSFHNLTAGTYQVFVKDANDCESNQNVILKTGIAFGKIKSIIQNNCATASCHGGPVVPNFTTDAAIQNQAGRIKIRTSAQTMPPAGSGMSLTNQEIAEIGCWVDDGANL